MRKVTAAVVLMNLLVLCWAQINSTVANNTIALGRKTLYIGAFFNLHVQDGWSTLAMAQMAVDEINNNTTLLPDHQLQLVVESTKGNLGYGQHVFSTFMNKGKRKIMLLGPDDDLLAKTVASYAGLPQYQLLQFSPRTTSLDLANHRSIYPYFFRTQTSDSHFDQPRIDIMTHFQWKEVGLIYGDLQIYYDLTQQFKARLRSHGITVLADVRLQSNDPARPVRTMLSKDVHVILGLFDHDSTARKMFCEAYKQRMYGPHYVWILVMSENNGWWNPGSHENLDCTSFEMTCQLQNHIYLRGTNDLPDGTTKNQAGKNYSTIVRDYYARVDNGNSTSNRSGVYQALQVYDAVYSIANVLHNSRAALLRRAPHYDLENVTYGDKNISELFYNETLNLNFFSPYLGNVRFFSNGDRKYDARLYELVIDKDGRTTGKHLGTFDATKGYFASSPWSNFVWLAGTPYVKTTETYNYPTVHTVLFAAMVLLSCLGIIYALLCFIVLIKNFNDSVVKKSGPIVNLFIIIGCVLNYVTVILYGLDYGLVSTTTVTSLCRARAWTFAIGFTLSVGGLVAKQWIAYCVLSKRFVKNERATLAWMLVILVVLFVADVVMMTCWEVTDPLYRALSHYRDQPQYKCGGTITADTFRANIDVVEHCVCTNLGAWLTLVLIPKGIVVLFGTFMAWQTRKVYIRQLNDTQHCAVCMIAICVCSFIGLVCAFTVARYPSTYYGVIGSLVFLSTTIILVWLFAHKISRVQCKPRRGKLITVGGSADVCCFPYCGFLCSKYCPCCVCTASCLVSWCPCFPFCSPYTCCRSPCCRPQVHPDSSQHRNEVDFYIAGKGQDKDAEIVLLKQTIKERNEELKSLRSKHGTVTQAATQTIDWFSDGEDGCYGDSHTPDGGGGSDGSRNGYQRNRNKFRIFNQRMDFSHVQSKVDTGVHKSQSPSPSRRGKAGDEQYSLWDPVRRNSRLLTTTPNRSARHEEEISKLKLILAQKESEIQRLLKDLESAPSVSTSRKTTRHSTSSQKSGVGKDHRGNEHVLDEVSHKFSQAKESQDKEKDPRGKKITESESCDPGSTKKASTVVAPTASGEGTASVTEHPHSQSSSTAAGTSSLKERIPNVTFTNANTEVRSNSNQSGSSQRSSIPVNKLTDTKQVNPARAKKDSMAENGDPGNTSGRLTDEENRNASWLELKTDQDNGKKSSALKEVEDVDKEHSEKERGERKGIGNGNGNDLKSDVHTRENCSKKSSDSKVSDNSENVVIESSGFDGDDGHEDKFYFEVNQKNIHHEMEEGESEEGEEFDIEPIDEESEDESDKNDDEIDVDDAQGVINGSGSETRRRAARRRRRLRNPGGRLNWNAESKVKSISGYKPRKSEKKIKTYKLDYSNAKSRLYSSSKVENGVDDSKIKQEINPRLQKRFSNVDHPNVRPKLYEVSTSLAHVATKPVQHSSKPQDLNWKTSNSYNPYEK